MTPLSPSPSGWRSLLRRSSYDLYDFGHGLEEWQRGPSTIGYLLPDAVAISYGRLHRHERRNRQFVSLLAVKTGHIAIGGVLTGWRLSAAGATPQTPDRDDKTNPPRAVEIAAVEGAVRLEEIPRLVIPESRLVPVASWGQWPEDWPALRQAHNLPPDGRPQATIRDPARVAHIFAHIQATPGGLP